MIERRLHIAPNRRSSGSGDRGNQGGRSATGANPVGSQPAGSATARVRQLTSEACRKRTERHSDLHRDLSCPDVWQHSIERSRARRGASAGGGRFTRPAPADRVLRDLTDPELWLASQARSRRRHEADDPTFDSPARGLSVAALLLLAGGSATAVASSLSGGGKADAAGGTAKKRVAATEKLVAPRHRAPELVAQPVAKAPALRTAAAVTTPEAPRRGGRPPAQDRDCGRRRVRPRHEEGARRVAASPRAERGRRGRPPDALGARDRRRRGARVAQAGTRGPQEAASRSPRGWWPPAPAGA